MTKVVGTLTVKHREGGNELVVDVDLLDAAIAIRDYDFMLRHPRFRFTVRNAVERALRDVGDAFDSMIQRSK